MLNMEYKKKDIKLKVMHKISKKILDPVLQRDDT